MEELRNELDYMKNLDQTFVSEPIKRICEAGEYKKREKNKPAAGDTQTTDLAASPIAEQVSSQLRVSTKKAFPDHLVSLLAYSIDNNMTSSAKCISSVEQDFKSQCEKVSCDPSNFGCIDRLLKESEALAME